MKTQSKYINEIEGVDAKANLVMYAFDRVIDFSGYYTKLAAYFPNAAIVGFSTSGHFIDEKINDEDTVCSVIEFEKSQIKTKSYKITDYLSAKELGNQIGKDFSGIEDLKGINIISDGGLVNGTVLIKSINKEFTDDVAIFGGMAGDQTRFEATFVGLNQVPESGNIVVIAYIGKDLIIKTGSKDGWESMGIEYTITKSEDNVLYELDNKNAYTTLYQLLEPEDQEAFTKNTLYYPFQLKQEDNEAVIRTPILVDHANKLLTYAGNMPEGSKVKVMKCGTMDLLDSTQIAAESSFTEKATDDSFIMAISCVGRRVVLDEMASEEFAEIKSVFKSKGNVLGFYSYGEFARTENGNKHCMLHNQTFTIASITEI